MLKKALIKLITVVFAVFATAASAFAAVSIVSAESIKGSCYTAGQALTITINASHTQSWAKMEAMVISSTNATVTWNSNSVPDDDAVIWGTADVFPDNLPSWESNVQIAAGTATGASVTGYQIVANVPASYTLGGTRYFFVVIGYGDLALGEYYVGGNPETAYIALSECSLDTPTPTPTITPTLYAVWNCAEGSWSNRSCAPVELLVSTPTNTPTRTPTQTSTPTRTSTETNTVTSTRTSTPTSTETLTVTPTITITFLETMTNTPTSTPTPSVTHTLTATPTTTVTITFTATPTATPSSTITITRTSTPTVTVTITYTPTATITITYWESMTNTPTITVTRTATNTATETITYTDTPTMTATRTITFTATETITFTDTPTITLTSTPTSTPTETLTITETRTPTCTPTITPTLPPFPYILTINLYNEAGELVRSIAKTRTSDLIGGVGIYVKDVGASDTKYADTNNVATSQMMRLFFGGIETPDTVGMGYTDFYWYVDNDASQMLNSGMYYMKLEQKDEYGHTNIIVEEIHVIRVEEYVELNIFNSGGELVRKIREYRTPSSQRVSLAIKDILVIEKDGSLISIPYGTGVNDLVKWDGLNNQGKAVSSGTYEIQVVVKTSDNKYIEATKTVVILNEGKKYLDDVKIIPNPYTAQDKKDGRELVITWSAGTDNNGETTVRIYNMAGELVKTFGAEMQISFMGINTGMGGVSWNMRTASNDYIASGYYVVVVETKNDEGYIDRKVEKLAIKK